MTDLLPRTDFGPVLRDWRNRRHRSQLALATEAGVSQRHISFLETGRSKPSREMVVHLGVVLDLPLRDRNSMLLAAGYAPVYAERTLDDPELADVRRALDTMLQAHDPFPAYVVDRTWDLVLANDAALRLVARLPESAQLLSTNVLRLVCHPDGLRASSPHWQAGASVMLRRLQSEVASQPSNATLSELLDEVMAYPGMPSVTELAAVPSHGDLLTPISIVLDEVELSLFTTITSLISPIDITLEELRLETLLPANAETDAALRSMSTH